MEVGVWGLEVLGFWAWVVAEAVPGPLMAVFGEDRLPEKFQLLHCSELEGTSTQRPADWMLLEELQTCCPNPTRRSSSLLLPSFFLSLQLIIHHH